MWDRRFSAERSSTAAPLPGAVHKQPICARLVRLGDPYPRGSCARKTPLLKRINIRCYPFSGDMGANLSPIDLPARPQSTGAP